MHRDQKPGIRVTVERISVTTIRTRSTKTYCEICRRSLGEEDVQVAALATEPRNVTEAASAASATDKKGEIE